LIEREIWFIVKESEKSGLDGYDVRDPEYYTGNGIYVLHYKGENIEVVLRRRYDEEREKNTLSNKNPYYIIWELIRINKPERLKDVPDEEIIAILKEVLSVYVPAGITFIPKNILTVQFKF